MKYRDENDKCFGVAGMAIGFTVWNAEDMYSQITIDAEGFDCISFTPQYFYIANQSISAKSSWTTLLERYKMIMGISIANVLCRKMIGDRSQLTRNQRDELLALFSEEGRVTCQLDDDEIIGIFNKSYNHLTQVFSHYRVIPLVTKLAQELKNCRTMSRNDIAQQLSILK